MVFASMLIVGCFAATSVVVQLEVWCYGVQALPGKE
jgi:hypothetical protein